MKRKNKFLSSVVLSTSILTTLCSGVAFATTWVSTTVQGIPGGGGSSANFSTPVLKETVTQSAGFRANYISAAFGLNGQICDGNAVDKSYQVELIVDQTVNASAVNSPLPNNYYYPKGITKGWEYSGGQLWRGTFTAY